MTLFADDSLHLIQHPAFQAAILAFGWVGHACILTAALNFIYGRPLSKPFLRVYRLATGVAILAFPLLHLWRRQLAGGDQDWVADALWEGLTAYTHGLSFGFGAFLFPAITWERFRRPRPVAVIDERTETVNYGKELGPAAVGDGNWRWAVRLPFTDALKVDFTEMTLAVPNLPAAWDGLTVLLVTDVHFQGTPSRLFFERVIDRLAAAPPPDLVVLAGDYVDTDTHHAWIAPLLGRPTATGGKFAVLGNHDYEHDPEPVRRELAAAGYDVLGNGWREAVVRGERCVVIGHEGPWSRPAPDLSAAPPGLFRLCVSHTPDNFYWGQRNGVGLMLCGHVHGGQVRVPVVGSIFVPSVYGRRFDMGVFEGGGTVMVVGRGLGGKEPLRVRCRPQVIRLTLRPRSVG